jgi:hypothetical protein
MRARPPARPSRQCPRRTDVLAAAASFAATLSLAAATSAAFSDPVFRCGHAYASWPGLDCPDAQAVDADDPRSGAQRAEALEIDRRQKALAARLEAERHLREMPPAPPRPARTPAQRVTRPPAPPHATASAPRRTRRAHAQAAAASGGGVVAGR